MRSTAVIIVITIAITFGVVAIGFVILVEIVFVIVIVFAVVTIVFVVIASH